MRNIKKLKGQKKTMTGKAELTRDELKKAGYKDSILCPELGITSF